VRCMRDDMIQDKEVKTLSMRCMNDAVAMREIMLAQESSSAYLPVQENYQVTAS
jgi:hypothetical protein